MKTKHLALINKKRRAEGRRKSLIASYTHKVLVSVAVHRDMVRVRALLVIVKSKRLETRKWLIAVIFIAHSFSTNGTREDTKKKYRKE